MLRPAGERVEPNRRLQVRSTDLQVADEALTFPVSLLPEQYLETGADGGSLAEIKPQGKLQLNSGDNTVRLACGVGAELATRAEVTRSATGESVAGARRPGLKPTPKGAVKWYPSLMPAPSPGTEGPKVLPGNGSDLRAVRGGYELAGGTLHSLSTFNGQDNAWEVTSPAATPVALTITRLGLSPKLRRCLATTNLIESPHSGVRLRTRRVTNWQGGGMVLRWAAGAFLATEANFRRIGGYRELWMLKAALDEETTEGKEATAA